MPGLTSGDPPLLTSETAVTPVAAPPTTSLSDATPAELEPRLEASLLAAFGVAASVLVRTAADWSALVAGLPFPDLAADDPSHVVAMILRDAPDAARCEALQAAIGGRERAVVRGPEREAFFRLVENAFVREDLPATQTRKAVSKRTRVL